MRIAVVFVALSLSAGACKKKGAGGDSVEPVTVDATEFTYRLEEGTTALPLWTAPCVRKVQARERPPEETRSGLLLHAARGEFEPVQLIVGPGSGAARVSVSPADLGEGSRVQVYQGTYEEGWVEHLTPLSPDDDIELSRDYGVPLWMTFYIPREAPAGAHDTRVTLSTADGEIEIPVTVHVFDFALPEAIHFATQLNIDVQGLIPEGGAVDDAKTLLFEHRMTPKSVTWPSGFNWGITWENDRSDAPCQTFWDEPDEPDEYSIGYLARRYILGEGWNGTGFPNAMVFQFVDNDTPRPESFCGESRGDPFGSDAYNAEWSRFLTGLEGYLSDGGFMDKAYYYVQNEPQDDDDYALAAHLCRLTKAAAPGLRIAVSEEPKPEIAEHPDGGCGYDIWIAYVRHYQQTYAWERQRDFGEVVWFYSLDDDPDPYFNPTRADVSGLHQRIIPWVAWGARARGFAYYDAGRFFDGPNPTVRAELLREGFEDYEYLYLANGGAHPEVFAEHAVDATAASVASSLTSWTKDPDALMTLRRELGRYLEGSREDLPVLEVASSRPKGEYFINFQDPEGEPAADPLVIDGDTYIKVGWGAYDAERGYGWFGENVDNPDIALYGYDAADGYNEAERSTLYDDYGRDALFEFDLAAGTYEVTVGLGRPARGYADPHNATVEGIPAVTEQPTTDDAPTIRETVRVDVTDGKLSLEVGGLSETTGEWSYTFVAYLIIRPV